MKILKVNFFFWDYSKISSVNNRVPNLIVYIGFVISPILKEKAFNEYDCQWECPVPWLYWYLFMQLYCFRYFYNCCYYRCFYRYWVQLFFKISMLDSQDLVFFIETVQSSPSNTLIVWLSTFPKMNLNKQIIY